MSEGSPHRPVTVSVVVPTVGRPARLFLTVSAVCRQAIDTTYEVVVVDDSTEPAAVADVVNAVDTSTPLRVVVTGGRGAASARNAGARAARGRCLLFLDDDTVVDGEVVAQHLAAQRADDRTVVHGTVTDLTAFMFTPDRMAGARGLTGARDRRLDLTDLARLSMTTRLLGRRRSFIEQVARVVSADSRYESLRWLLCIGTNTSMPRSLFERAGGFDTEYDHRWGGEDLELGLRLMAAGAVFSSINTGAYHIPLARRDVASALTTFWHTVAQRHSRPSLALVGEFLRGDIPLDELAARLAG